MPMTTQVNKCYRLQDQSVNLKLLQEINSKYKNKKLTEY